jgi:hypothetical protein
MQPQWHQTREQIEARPVVRLLQDTTDVDLSHHPTTRGLGQEGLERGRGLYVQTVLAVLPESGEVLGCAMQEPLVRTAAPAGETRSKRRPRAERETDVWMRLVTRLGSKAAQTTVVHVADPRADMFPFFHACQATQPHFLVRACENRRIHVPASQGRTARSRVLHLAFGPLTVLPPRGLKRCSKEPLVVWAIRVS